MALSAAQRNEIIKEYGISDGDTGSAQVQIALITERLKDLQNHFHNNKKDHHSRRGLLKLVGRRRSLLDYLKEKNVEDYRKLIAKLGIRK